MPAFGVKLKSVEHQVSVAMSGDWIDAEGFRANVGIILANDDGQLMLAGRAGNTSQFASHCIVALASRANPCASPLYAAVPPHGIGRWVAAAAR